MRSRRIALALSVLVLFAITAVLVPNFASDERPSMAVTVQGLKVGMSQSDVEADRGKRFSNITGRSNTSELPMPQVRFGQDNRAELVVGNAIEVNGVESLKVWAPSQELEGLLGSPNTKTDVLNGTDAWFYAEYKLVVYVKRSTEKIVEFNSANVVEAAKYASSASS